MNVCFTLSQITMVVLNWVTEHFPDFEGSQLMIEFLDWFESRLLEDVSSYSSNLHVMSCQCNFSAGPLKVQGQLHMAPVHISYIQECIRTGG